MSRLLTRHPENGQLLLYLDGELPAFKARRVRRHVEACWECRAEIRELEKTMAECVGYRRAVLQEHIPAPPQPWIDITREFARADRLKPVPPPHRMWLRPVAALAVVLVGILIYQLWRTPPVQAATLLRRAVAAEDTRHQKPRHLRIRTNNPQPLLRQSDYNWDSPLSVRSYQAWRDGLPRKRDEVTTLEDRYRIRTTTDTGALASATLTLRAADLWPVEGRFEFRNQDWVEVTEAPEETPAPPVAEATSPERRAGIAPPAAAPPPDHFPASAPEISGLGLELQVVAALHRAGADLGDPIEISRDGERILVAGTGVAPQRQNQIHSALQGLPNVALRFSNPNLSPQADPSPAVPDTPADSQSARLQARIEAQLGGHAQFEKFSARLLDRSDAAMAQAYALRRLAREFSSDTESGLETKDRAVLRDIGREHVTVLAGELSELHRSLDPLIGSGAERPHSLAATWQASAEQAFDSTSRVEKLIAVYLGATPGDGPSADVPGSLAAALARLQVDLNNCRRFLGR